MSSTLGGVSVGGSVMIHSGSRLLSVSAGGVLFLVEYVVFVGFGAAPADALWTASISLGL